MDFAACRVGSMSKRRSNTPDGQAGFLSFEVRGSARTSPFRRGSAFGQATFLSQFCVGFRRYGGTCLQALAIPYRTGLILNFGASMLGPWLSSAHKSTP